MKVAVFGARGRVGRQIVAEALERGLAVDAVVRSGEPPDWGRPVGHLQANVLDPGSVAAIARHHPVVVSAVGPGPADPAVVVEAAHSLVDGMRRAATGRLLIVGGAGSLEAAPGTLLMETPGFPTQWLPIARAHFDALRFLRSVRDVDWTCFSPSDHLETGPRTGEYRIGGDRLLTDASGRSRVTIPDFAAAIVDEVERPRHSRRRVTVGYGEESFGSRRP